MIKTISDNLKVEITKMDDKSNKKINKIIESFNAINKTNSRYIFVFLIIAIGLIYAHKNKLL